MIDAFRNHIRLVAAGALVALAALAWLAFGYFGVQTLFIDEEVSEALPTFDTPVPPAPTAAGDPIDQSSATPTSDPTDPEPTPADPTDQGTATSTPDPNGAAPPSVEDPMDRGTTNAVPQETDGSRDAADGPTTAVVTELVGRFESDAHPTTGTAVVLGNGTGQRFLRFEDFETDNGPDLNVYLVNGSAGGVSDFVDLGDLKGNIGAQNYELPLDVDLDVYDRVVIWCVRFGVGFGGAELMAA